MSRIFFQENRVLYFLLIAFTLSSCVNYILAEYLLYGRYYDRTVNPVAFSSFDDEFLVLLINGQSNSVNDSSLGYEIIHKDQVYMFFDNEVYFFSEPTFGGTGKNGNPWGRLADQIIDNGMAQKVVIALVGRGGASIETLSSYRNVKFLNDMYDSLMNQFGKVDYFLFFQGESDVGNAQYYEQLDTYFFENIYPLDLGEVIISKTSLCREKFDNSILKSQEKLAKKYNYKQGPNTDAIAGRHDGCHFDNNGLDELSRAWFEVMK